MKAKKDTRSVNHNKLKRNYKNMERILLKQQKELEELRMDIGNVCKAKNDIKGNMTKGLHKWTKNCKSKWPLMKSCKNF
jgi:hypothetical protein